MTTLNMNLDLPVVGPLGTIGPDWATKLNTALTSIDEHDHTPGKGVKITPAGMNVNTTLEFNGYGATELLKTQFESQGSTLTGSSNANAVYVVSGNLYFTNSSGTAVQITSGTGLSLTALGTIGGDYSSSDAELNYISASTVFTFLQDGTSTADISCGSVFIYENTPGANYVKIKSPSSLSASYDITLLSGLPASTLPLSLSASGVLSASTITTAQITDLAITTAKITDSNVTTAKIADSNVTTAKIADNAVTQAKRAALGQQTSAEITTFTSTSTSFVDVTNMSVSITTTGRPVFVGIMSSSATNEGHLECNDLSSSAAGVSVKILRDATGIANYFFDTSLSGVTDTNQISIPSSSIWYVDAPAAGTYTYKVQVSVSASGDSFTMNYSKLIAFEL